MTGITRRDCLKLGLSAGILSLTDRSALANILPDERKETYQGMKLGLVTYNLAKDWDIPAIIQKCEATGFEAVELRTTHAHGVEPTLSKAERAEVRKRFEDSKIRLWGLGSICDFHMADQAVVKQNIETCNEFTILAKDVGAKGVKVRPNGFQEDQGISKEQTIEQIGLVLRKCGEFASDHGIEIWLEVHGRGTSHPPYIRQMLDICGHSSVGACWNSNNADVKDGSVKEHFMMLRPDLMHCHINELWKPEYPWRELFTLMNETKYDRYTFAEIPDSPDSERLMRYYSALWKELTR